MKRYLLIILIFNTQNILAQNLARINGQMIIKNKGLDGKISVTSGSFYYDTKIKKLIYNLIFPTKTTYISKDSSLYKIENGKIVSKIKSYAMPQFSIFHLALYGGLSNYGLSKSGYNITNTQKIKDMVYITYQPDKLMKGMGKVVISQKNGQLYGIVFYNTTDNIVSKQFYQKYTTEKGISFPKEVVNITYTNGKELYQITNYNKITINDFKDNKNFDFKLSY
jgi:hypothetical protein